MVFINNLYVLVHLDKRRPVLQGIDYVDGNQGLLREIEAFNPGERTGIIYAHTTRICKQTTNRKFKVSKAATTGNNGWFHGFPYNY
jgi:hypothetical protein